MGSEFIYSANSEGLQVRQKTGAGTSVKIGQLRPTQDHVIVVFHGSASAV